MSNCVFIMQSTINTWERFLRSGRVFWMYYWFVGRRWRFEGGRRYVGVSRVWRWGLHSWFSRLQVLWRRKWYGFRANRCRWFRRRSTASWGRHGSSSSWWGLGVRCRGVACRGAGRWPSVLVGTGCRRCIVDWSRRLVARARVGMVMLTSDLYSGILCRGHGGTQQVFP